MCFHCTTTENRIGRPCHRDVCSSCFYRRACQSQGAACRVVEEIILLFVCASPFFFFFFCCCLVYYFTAVCYGVFEKTDFWPVSCCLSLKFSFSVFPLKPHVCQKFTLNKYAFQEIRIIVVHRIVFE